MKRRAASIAIVVFWAGMMAWLIRYEAYPAYFEKTLAGYRDLLADAPLVSDHWMKILIQGVHVGYSHTQTDLNEANPLERYIINNQTVLTLNLLGTPQDIGLDVAARLDALYNLQMFKLILSSRQYNLRLTARRRDENTFNISIVSPAGKQSYRMEIPGDAILYSPMLEMAMKKLRPGQTLTIQTLDPTTLTPLPMLVKALRRENITVAGREQAALVLACDYGGMEIMTWLDADGMLLRQVTPMGWVMEAAAAEEAVAIDRRGAQDLDLLATVAIRPSREIDNPAQCRELRVRLKGRGLAGLELNSPRQRVESADGASVVLAARADAFPAPGDPDEPLAPEAAAAALAPSMYLQSDHPDIVARAAEITRGLTGPRDQAQALCEWVYRNVKKNPTVSLPSALDVLRTREGDCNEHTYLCVALARAAGIPAVVKVGVMYTSGAFYYHAWPALHVGRWVELDPTLGQVGVDATHLALLTGEIAEQMKLLSLLGATQAEILETHY